MMGMLIRSSSTAAVAGWPRQLYVQMMCLTGAYTEMVMDQLASCRWRCKQGTLPCSPLLPTKPLISHSDMFDQVPASCLN
jgi:hypothetical protein